MAFQSRDGQKFTNLSQARAADRREIPVPGRKLGTGGKQPLPTSSFPKPEPARKESLVNDKPTPSDDDTSDLSQEVVDHGPASHVTITNKGDGQHDVVATLGDGVKHRTTHSSAEDAHSAARTLSGLDSKQDDDTQDMGNPSKVML